jgi:cytochrome P450
MQEEVDSTDIAQDKKPHSSSSVYSWATTQNMPYLDACIREAMRLHPAQRIPQDRMVSKGGLIVRGHRIPEGTDIGVFSSVLHRRLEVFGDDADTYRPERWLTDDQEKKTQMKNSMFTFGHGKYNCMGKNISKMEMYKVIPTLIKNFTVSDYLHITETIG